jgi:tRNA 5-methylaminomethyl-2-thiouridine biosynthesis bifunctional protein
MRLEPAELAFDENGQPWSRRYQDIYHGIADGSAKLQAHHVFLGGNHLPARWAGAEQFSILEIGFGAGLNFLATWQAWRDDPARCRRLQYVAIEKHPFNRKDLQTLHARHPGFANIAAALQAAWPRLTPGLHRLTFDDGGGYCLTLTLAFADIRDAIDDFRFGADAFYLDGFAPERNPDMWDARVMRALARLARPGATFATYTTAGAVRDALAAAGFSVGKHPGFGPKRHMLAGEFAPRGQRRHVPPAAPNWPERHVLVIGAGLAGAAVGERLSARGWAVELIEQHSQPAAEASGLRAGAFHPQLSGDDNFLARLSRAGFLYALRHWQALEAAGHGFEWERCGVLRLAQSNDEESQLAAVMHALDYPASYADYANQEQAAELSGCKVNAGGWWFPDGGWVKPASLVSAQLAAQLAASAQQTTQFNREVAALEYRDGRWQALDAKRNLIAAAPVAVLANAHGAARLADFGQALASLRGQLTYLPRGVLPALRTILTGDGYVLPQIDGTAAAGATVDFEDDDAEPRTEGHEQNLAALERLLPGSSAGIDRTKLEGGVGFRCAAPDRLPLIGAVPDIVLARERSATLSGAHTPDLPRLPGLYAACAYGSRGLTWAALAGEIIADLISGEPPPLEASLLDAVDPGRFVLKRARREQL